MERVRVTDHSASSMQSRFLYSITHHLSEVLHCTPEGRRKYKKTIVKEILCKFTKYSNNLEKSPAVLSDLSFFTSDNSVHDGVPDDRKLFIYTFLSALEICGTISYCSFYNLIDYFVKTLSYLNPSPIFTPS